MLLEIPLDAAAENRLRERAKQAGVDVAELVRRLLDDTSAENAAARFNVVLDEALNADEQPLPASQSTYPRSEIYIDHD